MIDQKAARRKLAQEQLALQDAAARQWGLEQALQHDAFAASVAAALASPVKAALIDLQAEWEQPRSWQKIVTRRGVLQ